VSDLFQEVQEEYRREQMAKLWAKYRVPVIAGVSAVVLGVAGYQGWSYWHAEQVEASSREFEKVAELVAAGPGNEKAAADRFAKLTQSATSGYAMAAKFQEAALRAEMGDVKAAVKLYDEIAARVSDPLFRDYAQLRGTILIIEAESLENVRKRLEPLTTGTGPWRVLALEMLAYASFRAGKKDEALKLYAEVQAAPNAPDNSTRRAKEMTTLINAGLKLSDLNARTSSQPATGPMLLQPAQPTPEAGSLLGPAPEQPPTP
jgi:hypothetical protein